MDLINVLTKATESLTDQLFEAGQKEQALELLRTLIVKIQSPADSIFGFALQVSRNTSQSIEIGKENRQKT